MRSFAAVLVVTLALLAGCAEPGHFADDRIYHRLASGFDVAADCEAAAQQQPLLNCWPSIELCPGGQATMVFTDIVNSGTYEVDGDQVSVRFHAAGDVPDRVTFAIQADDSLVSPQLGARPFTRAPLVPIFCED